MVVHLPCGGMASYIATTVIRKTWDAVIICDHVYGSSFATWGCASHATAVLVIRKMWDTVIIIPN